MVFSKILHWFQIIIHQSLKFYEKYPNFTLPSVSSYLYIDSDVQRCTYLGRRYRELMVVLIGFIIFDIPDLIIWKFSTVLIFLIKYLKFKLFKVNVNLFKVNFENSRLKYLRPMFLPYRNQSVDFPYRSIDWFLYE